MERERERERGLYGFETKSRSARWKAFRWIRLDGNEYMGDTVLWCEYDRVRLVTIDSLWERRAEG